MDVEESIRGNPIDGVVLLMGCDKTTPALLMGAASVRPADDRRLRRADAAAANYQGQDIGSGTGVVAMSARRCAPAR